MELNRMIDHTILKPEATEAAVQKIIDEAKEYNFFSVCINPCWVAFASEQLADTDVAVCTVIGFPLGANTPEVKAYEAADAIKNGANEVDMVINIGALKSQQYDYVRQAKEAGADFVKTSTGFSTGGAKVADIRLMRETVGPDMGVKASGGVHNAEEALAMIEAGATRIGASTGVAIVSGATGEGY